MLLLLVIVCILRLRNGSAHTLNVDLILDSAFAGSICRYSAFVAVNLGGSCAIIAESCACDNVDKVAEFALLVLRSIVTGRSVHVNGVHVSILKISQSS